MRTLSHIGLFVASCGLAASGLGAAGCDGDRGSDEADATAKTELSAKATGITVWADTIAHPTTRFGQPSWSFDMRTSKNLDHVFSFSSDDEFGEAIQVSPRKLQVFVDGGQMDHLLTGYRIIVDLHATSGSQQQYFAALQVEPRLNRFHGSSKITLRKTVTPFVYDTGVRFRNLVGFATNYTDFAGTTPAGGAPASIDGSGSSVAFDWLASDLLAVSQVEVSQASNEIDVSASTSGAAVHRFGGVDLVVTSLKLTTSSSPLDEFGYPQCEPDVLECLLALPQGQLDRSSCGKAIEVMPCMPQVPQQISAGRFASDLSSYLGDWYATHGSDVAAGGGNTLEQAQAACDAASVTEIADPEADPHGHDLSKFIVFSHPDVVFPGSDTRWFGAYDRATGQRESLYDFN